jgi:hypothetical protein
LRSRTRNKQKSELEKDPDEKNPGQKHIIVRLKRYNRPILKFADRQTSSPQADRQQLK